MFRRSDHSGHGTPAVEVLPPQRHVSQDLCQRWQEYMCGGCVFAHGVEIERTAQGRAVVVQIGP